MKECYLYGNMLTWQRLNVIIKDNREDIGTVRPQRHQRGKLSKGCDPPKPLQNHPEVSFSDVSCNLAVPLPRMTPWHCQTVTRKQRRSPHANKCVTWGKGIAEGSTLTTADAPKENEVAWACPFLRKGRTYVITANESRNNGEQPQGQGWGQMIPWFWNCFYFLMPPYVHTPLHCDTGQSFHQKVKSISPPFWIWAGPGPA